MWLMKIDHKDMETIESFKSIYQAYLESNLTVRDFCKNHDAAEDAAVMYTMMGCCKIAGVNVEKWLTYYLDHVHEYDNDYSRDLAELLPYALEAKGILKK